MKIKTIACGQFAGIRDKSISLTDGINLVCGKNESGKSTLVNLLSRTLFQNVRIDGRKDKEFKKLYFPSELKTGDNQGDFIDGTVTIETPKGIFTLTKEWGDEPRCTLSTPDGMIRDQKRMDALLKEILLYGEGVYSDMLFSSQHNSDTSLQTILDAAQKTDAKQEIIHAVSRAFAESDGITADAVEEAIRKRIEEIAGKHWDMEKGIPVRNSRRWAKDLGEILTAYYQMEDAEQALETIHNLEKVADETAADYKIKDNAALEAEDAYSRFQSFAGLLTVQSERRKRIAQLEKEVTKCKDILVQWPLLTDTIRKATVLKAESEHWALYEQYESAKRLSDEIIRLQEQFAAQACPSWEEIAAVKKAQKNIAALEQTLCGMNLNAAIRMLGDHTVHITSLRTGQELDITDHRLPIAEAVTVMIPGVMEMQLSPANVNVSETETAIAAQRKILRDIFTRYGVADLEALEELAKSITDAHNRIELRKEQLSAVLGKTEYAALKSAVDAMDTSMRSKESIDADIHALCGSGDIVRFLAERETTAENYAAEYGDMDALKNRADDMEADLQALRESVRAAEDIPAEYVAISDPDRHLAMLKAQLKTKQEIRDEALAAKIGARSHLESEQEQRTDDPTERAEQARRLFVEKKALLKHWLHIAEVFAQQKQTIQNHPTQDIAESFTRYLRVISEGRVSSAFPDPNQLNMCIYSGNHRMDYSTLSEGTKETVSLAFRLAVLDHLFPEGNGIIVLDDPFTDMDAQRVAQSCKLIQECAKRHQVIFLTCHEAYTEMLDGNVIRI